MPKIGDIISAGELNYVGTNKWIWVACSICKKERWVKLYRGKPRNIKCRSCAKTGKNSSIWKGGKTKDKGYIMIWVDPVSPFAEMTCNRNYVREHRLVMAKHLGRCLKSWEIVHHKNHVKTDNRIENLELFKISDHNTITLLEIENKKLRKEIKKLRGYVEWLKNRVSM